MWGHEPSEKGRPRAGLCVLDKADTLLFPGFQYHRKMWLSRLDTRWVKKDRIDYNNCLMNVIETNGPTEREMGHSKGRNFDPFGESHRNPQQSS